MGGIMGSMGGGMGGGMGGVMGGMGGMGGGMGPTVMPMGNNAFRQAMSNPPPQPMQTREVERSADDSDRFSTVSSTSSTGSELRSPTIQVGKKNNKSSKKTIFM